MLPSVKDQSPPSGGIPARGAGGFVIWRVVSNVVVLAALVGFGYFGHRTHWRLPRFSELIGNVAADNSGWCTTHDVPESECVECRPELLPAVPGPGWCKLHGIHVCPLCQPGVAQVDLSGYSSADELERVRRGLAIRERAENNKSCTLYKRRVQFASIEAMDRAGVEIDLAQPHPIVETIDAPGEIVYDPTKMARISSRLRGTVWRVDRNLGEPVAAGEVLAVIDASELGQLKSELLQNLVQLETRSRLLEILRKAGDAVPPRQLAENEAAVREARIRSIAAQQSLANVGLPVHMDELRSLSDDALAERIGLLGLPDNLVRNTERKTLSTNLLPIFAPLSGVIVQREAVVGEATDAGKPLFTVVAIDNKWLRMNVRPDEVRYLAHGQIVRFKPDGARTEHQARIGWISTSVDEKLRTVEVRAQLSDPSAELRAGVFGLARVVIREEQQSLSVPSTAVHWDGSCHIVFVRDKDFLKVGAPKVFHTRTVRLGVRANEFTEILAGVAQSEVVAAKGSAVLRAALLKNNLGAG